jgi:phospholipase A1/A2
VLAPPAARADTPAAGWQACTAVADAGDRLACFDRWSAAQTGAAPVPQAVARPPVPPAPVAAALDPDDGCHEPGRSELSRFWELERGGSCGVFGIRGYRPISLSLVAGDTVTGQPTSANPLNSATTEQPYRTQETRIQLSVRTKLAQGLLTGDGPGRDSLWFGYTQQSYWQLFTPSISRPFRSTDHEPEFVYVYPSTLDLPAGWRLRYSGLGVVHQSNGQSLPLSRSWNRAYLMAGAEHHGGLTLQGRVWKRIPEDAADDDNPDISDHIGRAEATGTWNVNASNTLALTLRHSLRSESKGSVRFEWLKRLDNKAPSALGNLRFHAQLFHGYGDSLLDYNRRRTVLGFGLSLVDW